MKPPNIEAFQRSVGQQTAIAAGKVVNELLFLHIAAIGEPRVGSVEIVRLNLREHEPYCLIRRAGGVHFASFNSA